MCGIVSLISKRQNGFFQADLEMFRDLLVLDTLRGLDSTGVFSVDNNHNVNLLKIASHPYHLFAAEGWGKWQGRASSNGRILVGHNRKATKGAVNSMNAHPFHEGNIVLVHNGSLREDHKKTMADVEVDSHAVCHAFNEKGAENVIPNINGAFAFVWWDIAKSRLYAVRNDERPLSIVETDDYFIMLSENWMALQLLARARKKIVDVIDILPGKLHEFRIGGQCEVTDVKLHEPDYSEFYTNGRVRQGTWQHGDQGSSVSEGKPVTTTSRGGTQVTNTTGKSNSDETDVTGRKSSTLSLVKVETTSRTEDKPPFDADLGHVPCTDYPRASQVLVKYVEMVPHANRAFYVAKGHTVQPGGAKVDVVSYIPMSYVKDGEMIQYMEKFALARVVKHTTSICGRSLMVNQNTFPETVRVHNMDITQPEWAYVVTSCECSQCKAKIYDEEQPFTAVRRAVGNTLKVTCADCIEDKLPGEMKHEFQQNRLAAVQAHIREREEIAGNALAESQARGTSTLH
jgi:hypothetical protein